MCPTLARRKSGELPCPLVSLTRSWVRILSKARKRPAKLEGLRLHPVPFRKIRGDAAELLHFPLRKGDYSARNSLPLALAQARKTAANSGRIQCRSQGQRNRIIVSKLDDIHKAKPRPQSEFITFIFNSLRGVRGRRLERAAAATESTEKERFPSDFAAIGATRSGAGTRGDDQMRMGITT